MIDDLDPKWDKTFMLHYNFPPFSVGEVGRFATGRREIGHGALAERSLKGMLPEHADFPYTIRIVSDILESNGSSSMASVCSGSLAMMDAAVPLKKACAGIAMGLVKEGEKIVVLSDIMGIEDFLGDMDFKVAGTRDGITGFQMDIKIEGVPFDVLRNALEQAREGRMHILDEMDKVLLGAAPDARPAGRPHPLDHRSRRTRSGTSSARAEKIIRGCRRRPARRSTSTTAAGHDRIDRRRGRRRGAAPHRGHHRGAGDREDLRGPREERDRVRRVRGDPAGPGRPRAHLGARVSARREGRGRAERRGHRAGKLIGIDNQGRVKLSRKALLEKPEG